MKESKWVYPNASVIVSTWNNSLKLKNALKKMLEFSYPAEYEVIVVNDGSEDKTKEMLEREFSKEKKITVINLKRSGFCKAFNTGFRKAKNPIVVRLDEDCYAPKEWLKKMVSPFRNERIGMVSSFHLHGGTATAFRKDLLEKIAGYDEEYFYFREDTDLAFRIQEEGFELLEINAPFVHDHQPPRKQTLLNLLKHFWKRALNHKNDVLLYKKHPKLAREFLEVKLGFLVNPMKDFRAATGTWASGVSYSLSSPRGITYIENKGPVHAAVIFLGGLSWVAALKLVRLYGSIKFKKLLL